MRREWLRKAREAAGLSQKQLRDRLASDHQYHVSTATISYWESGKSTPPVAACVFLGRVLGVDLSDIVREEIERKERPA